MPARTPAFRLCNIGRHAHTGSAQHGAEQRPKRCGAFGALLFGTCRCLSPVCPAGREKAPRPT